ncbi:MAG: PadR family transcriptional regulator [Caldilineaceae bacterium]|nr:PadR family transcriptional regulator [Caldilineaceae bacterium]MCB9151161.1 PadR family transcriptional regulator [Caldilineaceae bacterium]
MAKQQNKSRYAILGMLSYGSMSGYDIRHFFEGIAGFWSESYGQIYPNLNALAQEGLVTKVVEERAKGPTRHIYTITEEGRWALRQWLQQPAEPVKERNELLLKLIFGASVNQADNVAQIQAYKVRMLEMIGSYHIFEAWQQEQSNHDPHAVFQLMAVRHGLRTCQAIVEWCDECVALLETENKG